jgi:hypothetical protein
MANFEMKEIVNEGIKDAVEEAVTEKVIPNVTGKGVALGFTLAAAGYGAVKLIVHCVKKIQSNKELKLVERGDFVKPEDLAQDEEEAE